MMQELATEWLPEAYMLGLGREEFTSQAILDIHRYIDRNQQFLEWTALTPPAVLESTVFDVSASWDSMIHVDVAQSSTTANTTGIEIIVQGRKEDSLDEWTDISRINVLAFGAATKSDFAAQEAAGQTTLSITNPTTGKLNHLGKFVFLEDTATIAQCEIAFVVECGADS